MIQAVNKRSISEIFKKSAEFFYFIPKYQREYTWAYTEWEALYDDIAENANGYFIGTIIYINTNDSMQPRLEVVDGQQRLTTLSLYLTAIYHILKERLDLLSEDDREEYASLRKSLKNKYSDNGLIIVPQIQNYNKDDFNTVMAENGLRESGPRAINYHRRRICRCYHYFLSRLRRELENNEEVPEAVLLRILEKVNSAMLVTIEVSSHSDAYVLFESLNHRGTPLTAVDLMKNLIMAKSEKAGLTCDDCFEQWNYLLQLLSDDYGTQERFFRHYYNSFKNRLNEPFRKGDDKKKDPLGLIATKSNLLSIYERLINRDLNVFLKDIVKCGEIYNQFLFPITDEGKTALSDRLLELVHVQGVPSYILLLYLFRNKLMLKLSDKNIVDVINLLIVFFVRRNVTDLPSTRDITRIFMNLTNDIEEKQLEGEYIYNHVKSALKEVCASDEVFRNALSGDIYKRNVDAARYLLCALAQKAMNKETWTDLWKRTEKNVFVWTIEHVFPEGDNIPQCWIDMIAGGDAVMAKEYLEQYAHKIGNLTLTGYNPELGNYSFEKKRDRMDRKHQKYIGYRNGLEINKKIAEKDSWTIVDIEERTESLISEIIEMFTIV